MSSCEVALEASNSWGNIAVVGGGPAGMSAALERARLGAEVTLFERNSELGGQFLLAQRIPGKFEFNEIYGISEPN